MATELTLTANLTSKQLNISPQIVFTIDGITTKFGATAIYEYIRIGDDGLYIDNYLGQPWYIGGLKEILDQSDYISYSGGTTTRITQQLEPDKGLGTSASGLTVALIDKNEEITEIISPVIGPVPEILGRAATVQIGFSNNAYPEDYITIFKGIIETIDSTPGLIKFYLTSTEQKKYQTLFVPENSTLTTAISNVGSVTTIDLDDASQFPIRYLGPDGNYDTDIELFVRINREFFKYTGVSGNQLTGVTRNTTPFVYTQESHDIGDDVNSVIRISGSAIDIARKIMISGRNGFYETGLDIESFNYLPDGSTVTNSIFFFGVDVSEEYGFTVGDYITTTSASNGANNVSAKEIIEIVKTNDGSYLVIDNVTFVAESNTSGTLSIRSQWDTLGYGCGMHPNDVDLLEFDRLDRLFLGGFNYDFRLQNEINAKEFIESEIFRPITAFSILRRGRSSIGFHSPPIPGQDLITLNQDNVENAPRLAIKRSLSKNYYNTVTYKFNKEPLEGDFKTVRIVKDATSISDFNIGQRSISIASEGMRTTTSGDVLAQTSGTRYLNRYKRGSEFVNNIEVRFGDVYNLDIGDNILLDLEDLKISDIKSGTRSGEQRIFQILNKSVDLKTGKVTVSIVDTNFDGASRYALVSPASFIKTATSQTVFVIEESFNSRFGSNEYLKWNRFNQAKVLVRSPNSVTRYATSQIQSITGNTVTLTTALGFTPQPGDIMEFPVYNDQNSDQNQVYICMRNVDPFDDGKSLFKMI